jgi:hypothetical protein
MEKNIVTFLLHLLQVAYAVCAACDIALEFCRSRRVRIIDVDALKIELLLQIVMLVYTNLGMAVIWQQGKQSLAVNRL